MLRLAFSDPEKPDNLDIIHTHKVVGFVWNCDAVSLKEVSQVASDYRSYVKLPLLIIVGELGAINAIGYATLKLFMELGKLEPEFSWLLCNLFIAGVIS